MGRECEFIQDVRTRGQLLIRSSLPGRVWTFMENIRDTTYDFALVLRQMYTEAILREKLESVGAVYFQGMKCVGFEIDENAGPDAHAVTSTFADKGADETFKLERCVLFSIEC
jgi:phenol 2-monooxygenase